MSEQDSALGYMSGDGNSWGWFEWGQLGELLDGFVSERGLSAGERSQVWPWVESLPWNGRDAIELHFNW